MIFQTSIMLLNTLLEYFNEQCSYLIRIMAKRYNALYDQILLIGTKWKEKYNYNLMFFSFAISISFKSIASYPGVKNVNFHIKPGACESLTHWYVIVKRGSLSKASFVMPN